MLNIYNHNKLNNSADISIPLLFLKIHSKFRPRPIQSITSPADYLAASTLYCQLTSAVLHGLTSVLQAEFLLLFSFVALVLVQVCWGFFFGLLAVQ